MSSSGSFEKCLSHVSKMTVFKTHPGKKDAQNRNVLTPQKISIAPFGSLAPLIPISVAVSLSSLAVDGGLPWRFAFGCVFQSS